MRRRDVEFQVIGGFHDGVRTRVVDAAMESPLITFHEAMHGQIFRETPDGQVHRACCLALEHNLVSGKLREAVTESVSCFYKAARLPHESFATYLSIKLMPPSAEPALLAQLSHKYVRYFRLLANIVDARFTSHYLQFLIAWNCAVAVFSSPLFERFPTLDLSVPIRLTDDENPRRRFGSLLSVLRNADVTSLRKHLETTARDSCERHGFAYWDIFSELAWFNRTYSDGKYSEEPEVLEQALSEAMRQWLQSNVPFTFLHGARFVAAFEGVQKAMLEKLNLRVTDWSELGVKGANLKGDTVRRAALESESRIVNTKFRRLNKGNGGVLLSDVVFERISTFGVYSSFPPQRNLANWFVLAWTRGAGDAERGPDQAAEFEREEVVAFLEKWIYRNEKGLPVPTPRVILLAVQGFEEVDRIMAVTDSILCRHEELFTKLCWYWWTGFYDIYRTHADGGLLAGRIDTKGYLQYANADLQEMLWRYNGLMVKVLHYGKQLGAGWHMRAFPSASAGPLLLLENALIKSGKLQRMPHDLMQQFVPLATHALRGAKTLWPEY